MSSKLRSFRYTCWAYRHGHLDDTEIPTGRYVEADMWIELRGALFCPADPEWKAGEGEEPDWDAGAFFMDAKTRRPVPGTNMAGRPMDVLIEGWRSGRRCVDGVLIMQKKGSS